jgi:hypothetical protein
LYYDVEQVSIVEVNNKLNDIMELWIDIS